MLSPVKPTCPKAAGLAHHRHSSDHPRETASQVSRPRRKRRSSEQAVPLVQPANRRTETYLPLQHRYPSTYESFADILVREGISAPAFDPDTTDGISLPVAGQSSFASDDTSDWKAQSPAAFFFGPLPAQRSTDTFLRRKRTHDESQSQESTQTPPPSKVLDGDEFVVPTFISVVRRITPWPSSRKPTTVLLSPNPTSSISTDAVICTSSTSNSPGSIVSPGRSASQSSASSAEPVLGAKRIRLDSRLIDEKDVDSLALVSSAEDEEADDSEEVNLGALVHRRLSSASSGSTSQSVEILRKNLKQRQNSRRDADLEMLKSPPASWGYGITAPFPSRIQPGKTRRFDLPTWSLDSRQI